jgi:hypothetical protein
MVKINPYNVAKLLFDDTSAKYTKATPINTKEIELKDQLLGKKCILFIVYDVWIAVTTYRLMHRNEKKVSC